MKYVRASQRVDRATAAPYRYGGPLADVLAVARRMDPAAEIVEVPAWRLLLVRFEQIPDDAPAYIDYEYVADGQMLVYNEDLGVLYAEDRRHFEREFKSETDPSA